MSRLKALPKIAQLQLEEFHRRARQSTASFLLAAAVFLVFHFIFLFVPFACVFGPLALIIYSERYWWVGVLIPTIWAFTLDGSEHRSGKPWNWLINLPVWRVFDEYFNLKLVRSNPDAPPLDPKQTYIFAIHPHGVLAANRIIFSLSRDKRWDKVFPGIDTRDLAASPCFKIPGMREMWLWTNCIDASRESAHYALTHGHSILVYPGGEAEQLEADKGRHIAFLNKRKGFVKLAMQTDSKILPVYVFGDSDLYDAHTPLLGLRKWISKKFRICLPIFSGRFMALPYQVNLTAVVGDPITVSSSSSSSSESEEISSAGHSGDQHLDKQQQRAEPTAEALDEAHKRYIQALQHMFDQQKAKYGYAEANLEIL